MRTFVPPALAASPYNAAVRDGSLIFIAGQIGLSEDGGLVPGGIVPETEACLDSLARALQAVGATLSDVVKTLVFIVDFNDYGAFNDVYRRYFSADFPARSTVGTPQLALNARIEIEAVAIAA